MGTVSLAPEGYDRNFSRPGTNLDADVELVRVEVLVDEHLAVFFNGAHHRAVVRVAKLYDPAKDRRSASGQYAQIKTQQTYPEPRRDLASLGQFDRLNGLLSEQIRLVPLHALRVDRDQVRVRVLERGEWIWAINTKFGVSAISPQPVVATGGKRNSPETRKTLYRTGSSPRAHSALRSVHMASRASAHLYS